MEHSLLKQVSLAANKEFFYVFPSRAVPCERAPLDSFAPQSRALVTHSGTNEFSTTNLELIPFERMLESVTGPLEEMNANIGREVNNFQLCVAANAILLSPRSQFLNMVVGYGRGKSRCYFGVAHHFLANS